MRARTSKLLWQSDIVRISKYKNSRLPLDQVTEFVDPHTGMVSSCWSGLEKIVPRAAIEQCGMNEIHRPAPKDC